MKGKIWRDLGTPSEFTIHLTPPPIRPIIFIGVLLVVYQKKSFLAETT